MFYQRITSTVSSPSHTQNHPPSLEPLRHFMQINELPQNDLYSNSTLLSTSRYPRKTGKIERPTSLTFFYLFLIPRQRLPKASSELLGPLCKLYCAMPSLITSPILFSNSSSDKSMPTNLLIHRSP